MLILPATSSLWNAVPASSTLRLFSARCLNAKSIFEFYDRVALERAPAEFVEEPTIVE
jgi:hypothetical protein